MERTEAYEDLRKALEDGLECLQAAQIEGLQEKLAEADIYDTGSLADLIARRLLHGFSYLEMALTLLPALKPPAEQQEGARVGHDGLTWWNNAQQPAQGAEFTEAELIAIAEQFVLDSGWVHGEQSKLRFANALYSRIAALQPTAKKG